MFRSYDKKNELQIIINHHYLGEIIVKLVLRSLFYM